jgi:Zn finger protein HypA/HybF involved in hydrogenase expression
MFKLPERKLFYKGGIMMINRKDEPSFQCTHCYKPFFDDEVFVSSFLSKIECPNCQSELRKITENEPLITD